ncbi:TPA: hypothetical protein JBF89_13180 [Legionella pneumophila]|nr:hypothetical protein [Legionella pneumophila]HAU0349917.1 hypothetical protein [Legionella pneumophila]HAU0353408.1 hypothetical protein [Legionella pneumophila]HAU0359497.1 hypothetical protein [Legionella pneumophila]HAU0368054.1 hypothetical protein [Legionella pneumophila]
MNISNYGVPTKYKESVLGRFFAYIKKFKDNYLGYKFYLANVEEDEDSQIFISVLVQGIRKEIIKYKPDEIVFNDEFISGFSSCDARAITYLSFYKYIDKEIGIYRIVQQFVDEGKTIVLLRKNKDKNSDIKISAHELYKSYDLLVQLNKADMINIISTAVQEQTIIDMASLEG